MKLSDRLLFNKGLYEPPSAPSGSKGTFHVLIYFLNLEELKQI